jgi:hypothetical protein
MILRRRGGQISKKPKGFSGETQNHLESPWLSQVMVWKRKRTRVLRAALSPLIWARSLRPKHVQARSHTCPASQICLGHRPDMSQKLQKLPKKMIFNGFCRRANRIYICVAHGQVLKNKKYIYGLKPFES